MILAIFPIGHTDSHTGLVLTSIAKGPRFCTSLASDRRAPTPSEPGSLGWICLGRPGAPLVKLNTTEARLQRLQNYAAGTVTMTRIRDFSPPPGISMTNPLAHKKSSSLGTFLDVRNSEQSFVKPWPKWSCDQLSFRLSLHQPFHFESMSFQLSWQPDITRYGAAPMLHRRLPRVQRVQLRLPSLPFVNSMRRRLQSPC
jgi:hypothetical protein